jgi:hypothetical protein
VLDVERGSALTGCIAVCLGTDDVPAAPSVVVWCGSVVYIGRSSALSYGFRLDSSLCSGKADAPRPLSDCASSRPRRHGGGVPRRACGDRRARGAQDRERECEAAPSIRRDSCCGVEHPRSCASSTRGRGRAALVYDGARDAPQPSRGLRSPDRSAATPLQGSMTVRAQRRSWSRPTRRSFVERSELEPLTRAAGRPAAHAADASICDGLAFVQGPSTATSSLKTFLRDDEARVVLVDSVWPCSSPGHGARCSRWGRVDWGPGAYMAPEQTGGKPRMPASLCARVCSTRASPDALFVGTVPSAQQHAVAAGAAFERVRRARRRSMSHLEALRARRIGLGMPMWPRLPGWRRRSPSSRKARSPRNGPSLRGE